MTSVGTVKDLRSGRKSVLPNASTQFSVALGLAVEPSRKLQSRMP
jgi:hypothetical protein